MITIKRYGKIILIILVLLALWLFPSLVTADDHEKKHNDSKHREIRIEHDDESDDKREGNKDDKGNEVTGQIALWLLVAANLTVVFSILMKGVIRYFPLAPETKTSIQRFNQLQKRYLMRLHLRM